MATAGPDARSQLLRFLSVGVLTAAVDYTTYRLLSWSGVPVNPSKAVAFVVGTTLSYVLNRVWTFGAGERQHAVGRFLAVYAVTLVVNVAVNAAALRALAGVPTSITAAWVVAQGVASALNFLGMHRYVFADAR